MSIPGRKGERWLGDAAKLPSSMLVVAHPRLHREESGEQLRSLEIRLQAVFECGPRAVFPCRGAATKRKGHRRTASGHPSKPPAVIQHAGEVPSFEQQAKSQRSRAAILGIAPSW